MCAFDLEKIYISEIEMQSSEFGNKIYDNQANIRKVSRSPRHQTQQALPLELF